MKCSRCGSLWLPYRAGPESWRVLTHEQADCQLSLCLAPKMTVAAINETIEEARENALEEAKA